MGNIRHLFSPNQWHYAHIGAWQRAFPDAVAWASPGVRRRARARHIDVSFMRDLDDCPPEEWRDEIDQALMPGGIFKEFIFFHKASNTLILTDTIMNLGTRQDRSAVAGVREAQRDVLPARSNLLRDAAAADTAETKDQRGVSENPILATTAHCAQPRPLLRWER